MLGAGIYGLVGKAAGVAGGALWTAFLAAAAAALLTGLSYASVASRYPRAGGAAYVAGRAYRRPWLSFAVGMTVVCSGLLSIATQAKVVAENLSGPLGAPESVLAIGVALLLAGLVFRGITESLWVNAGCTVLEASGLILVVAAGARFWGSADLLAFPPTAGGGGAALLVLQGSVLTFFSFIGFEDVLNVAEEAEAPERTLPMALVGAMLIASALYLAVSVTAVSVVPWRELAAAPAPLRLVVERSAPWFPPLGFTAVTVAAVANTALVHYVMASRILYGMARQKLLPAALGRVHPRRRTPHAAVAAILAAVLALQLAGDVTQLAGATVLLLLVFAAVNGALVVLKRREGDLPGRFNAPVWVPAAGMLVCAALAAAQLAREDWHAPALAGGIAAGILLLYPAVGRRAAKGAARPNPDPAY